MFPRITRLVPLAMLVALAAAIPARAQVIGKIKAKITDRTERKTDEAIDKALDKAENAVNCAVGDDECVKAAKKAGKKVVMTDEDGKPLSKQNGAVSGAASETQSPGQGAWANYDFVPGERVLFADDFMNDRVGNFPRRLELREGNMEIIEKSGKRWLRMSAEGGTFAVTLPEVLPQRFTMEFDATVPANWCSSVVFTEADARQAGSGAGCGAPGAWIGIAAEPGAVGLGRGENFVAKRGIEDLLGEYDHGAGVFGLPFHVRLQVDGDYAKLYVGETRVANVPSIKIQRGNKIYFVMQGGHDERPLMVSSISVNAGGRRLYDALMADGHVATQGIFFDVGSDRIRPESTPTLKEIGQMLTEHADLKLEIQGHTDNTGTAASNRTLSDKRAASVKAYLVSTFGIDASRLTSKGYGDTKPVAPNTTVEGKQQNRRVELVKS